jgi:uncharacterized protein (TIGR00369 family)
MSRVTIDELDRLIKEDIPYIGDIGVVFEMLGDGLVTARLPFHPSTLRPGGTISGPTMMALADIVVFACVLSRIGMVKDAVTTNLNANFLRKPGPYDLVAEGRLLKCGRRLAYGEVTMFSEEHPHDVVCHAICTYSIPTKNSN